MHTGRSRVLLRADEAMINGRRLTLIDLARAWQDAQRVRAPLKALARLLGNAHLNAEPAWPAKPSASINAWHRSDPSDGCTRLSESVKKR